MEKMRLDMLLVEKGLFPSREKAKSAIMAGLVFVDGQRVDKAGTTVSVSADIEVQGNPIPYVSRGGLKLEKAIKEFSVRLEGKIVMDIGASTGGFTDCALQNGAAKVYSVDVGYGQLAWSLRRDPRVVNLERTNIRYLEKEKVPDNIEVITIDVSFISLNKVLPKAYELLQPEGQVIALIKPQFEAGREKVGKKGVVKDPAVHVEVIEKVITGAQDLGFVPVGLTFSPVKGPEGNIEYLLLLEKPANPRESTVDIDAWNIVLQAQHDFDKNN
ncbi:hemolysin A [Thermincola ferriacetica]|uniref:Hemolysin A n=2 Tax=Thermincola TaxID=278993 RepID=D5X7H7_THEPJ|nr:MULTISPECIES: TlyA family RNA methyltransferase [Thermincola]ADG82547.1 hemolysin A [Thermincola potens JR]KNZ70737.1 hemolysin A [Thermincola ferriacetica]